MIDEHAPEHRISSQSAAQRGHDSMYTMLARQTEALAQIQDSKEELKRAARVRTSAAQR